MSKFDHLALDGHSLQLFLAVLEEGSVTAAAARLGLTQSAVSHSLQKLREIARDPLFVKSGRGIIATGHAHALAEQARRLLDDMQAFSSGAQFEPASADLDLTIAANDFQRDLLLPTLLRQLEAATRSVRLRAIPSQLPSAEMLRENRCELLISPVPPAGTDMLQKRLLSDRYVCYYDAAMRSPPRRADDYLQARHVTVVYSDNERLQFDKRLLAAGHRREVAVSVPNFSGVPAFLRGTPMLASLPSLLRDGLMRDFAQVPIPLPEIYQQGVGDLPMYMVWHRRVQNDPAHIWLRAQVERAAITALQGGEAGQPRS
ncbi:LysR family transcriptional regulator [Ferrovibrio sp.]|uniref:LysR family transcriptional regulator n=1 Tax=Ferrovibrio sp. TaxID=1917215 RepID=UPI00260389FA|nr:LysR family transcriptional regulator [Ferrovibrio sp.]